MNRTNRYSLFGHLAFIAVILLAVPAALGFDGFALNTFARYLSLAIVAIALALSWGTAGILNLGQAATFGVGAYAMAMHLKLKGSAGNLGATGLAALAAALEHSGKAGDLGAAAAHFVQLQACAAQTIRAFTALGFRAAAA